MADLLVAYESPVSDDSGSYDARAVGRYAEDGMWEGWLEFVPLDGRDEVLVTSVESRQPERSHLVYWATGLTPVYLEGALERARKPVTVHVRQAVTPASSAPAPRFEKTTVAPSPSPEAVLDPFEIGGRSLDILRQELGALNRPRLANIIAAYQLNGTNEDLSWMSDAQLAHFIVTAVEAQMLLQRNRA